MKRFFVTAIGTEVGKTHIGAALLRALTQESVNAGALKPLMSGFDPTRLEESDAGRLLAACGRPVTPQTVGEIVQAAFEPALAPNVAARNAGAPVDYDALLAETRTRISAAAVDVLLIEGAGGVMSPVSDEKLHADFIADIGAPAILVTADYLGAVSHCLTAIECLSGRGVEIAAVVASEPEKGAGDPAHHLSEIARFAPRLGCDAPLLAAPFDAGGGAGKAAIGGRLGAGAGGGGPRKRLTIAAVQRKKSAGDFLL